MKFGVHLPLMDFGGQRYDLAHLSLFTATANELGFDALAVNDHLLFAVPWLDGPTALAAVVGDSGDMTLATTVALSVVRGPVPLAKSLAAIDILSGGRLIAAVGPGSSAADYEAAGVDFDERWPRFDESIHALRALWQRDAAPFVGHFYSTDGVRLDPHPTRARGIPIWVGSWGSEAGLRRAARAGDGWLASAYNTTPALFATSLARLGELLVANGKDPSSFPNALATMWFHVTDSRVEAERIWRERILPAVHRPEDVLRQRLPIGPPEAFAELLTSFAAAGLERVFVWPVADDVHQIEQFWQRVRPLVNG